MSFRKITLVFAMTVSSLVTAVESVCSPEATGENLGKNHRTLNKWDD